MPSFHTRPLIAAVLYDVIRATLVSAQSTPIMLNVQASNGFVGFATQLEVPENAGFGPNQMLVDTGSSGIAFCNKQLASGLTPASYPGNALYLGELNETCLGSKFLQGNAYGTHRPPTQYYWGYQYVGDILITSHGSDSSREMANVAYTIVEEYEKFTCDFGFDGIWGVAFPNAGSREFALLPSATGDPKNVLCFDYLSPCSASYDPSHEWCYDMSTNKYAFYFEPAIQKGLEESDTQLFGIYLNTNVAEFSKLVQAGLSYNVGMAYVGDDAINNMYYSPESVHATVHSNSNELYWNLPITSMQVFCKGSHSSSPLDLEDYCYTYACALDSGTKQLVFPDNIVNEIHSCSKGGSLQIKMSEGTLDIDLSGLRTLYKSGWVASSSQKGNNIVFGFPIWLFYYIVFNYGEAIANHAVITFVTKRHSGA